MRGVTPALSAHRRLSPACEELTASPQRMRDEPFAKLCAAVFPKRGRVRHNPGPAAMSTTANWAADLASYVASLSAPSREEMLATLPPDDAILIRAALWRMTVRARRFHHLHEGRTGSRGLHRGGSYHPAA
jgi:hypothetical protein